jgi:hypothetical protein
MQASRLCGQGMISAVIVVLKASMGLAEFSRITGWPAATKISPSRLQNGTLQGAEDLGEKSYEQRQAKPSDRGADNVG